MKSLVVYSSKTGNTEMVAQAVYEALPEPKAIYAVKEAPPPDGYDFIAMGFWVDRGTADARARKYMEKIKGKEVGLFGTLGAYPDSEHADHCRKQATALVKDNHVHGVFLCQGKVDPELIKKMAEMFKDAPDNPHAMTPERQARLAEAAKHPDEADLINAQKAILEMVNKAAAQPAK